MNKILGLTSLLWLQHLIAFVSASESSSAVEYSSITQKNAWGTRSLLQTGTQQGICPETEYYCGAGDAFEREVHDAINQAKNCSYDSGKHMMQHSLLQASISDTMRLHESHVCRCSAVVLRHIRHHRQRLPAAQGVQCNLSGRLCGQRGRPQSAQPVLLGGLRLGRLLCYMQWRGPDQDCLLHEQRGWLVSCPCISLCRSFLRGRDRKYLCWQAVWGHCRMLSAREAEALLRVAGRLATSCAMPPASRTIGGHATRSHARCSPSKQSHPFESIIMQPCWPAIVHEF